MSTCLPNEEPIVNSNPIWKYSSEQKSKKTHNPPLHFSTEVNKRMTQMQMEKCITGKIGRNVISN